MLTNGKRLAFNNFTVLRSELANKTAAEEKLVPFGPFSWPTGLPVPVRCRVHQEIDRERHAPHRTRSNEAVRLLPPEMTLWARVRSTGFLGLERATPRAQRQATRLTRAQGLHAPEDVNHCLFWELTFFSDGVSSSSSAHGGACFEHRKRSKPMPGQDRDRGPFLASLSERSQDEGPRQHTEQFLRPRIESSDIKATGPSERKRQHMCTMLNGHKCDLERREGPVVAQRQTCTAQRVQKTLEMSQLQLIDKLVDVFVSTQECSSSRGRSKNSRDASDPQHAAT